LEFPLIPKFGFDNFVVCNGNSTAFQFVKFLTVDEGNNLLYIYGPHGSGKTHLLRALAESFSPGERRSTFPYISFRDIDDIYHGDYPAEAVSKLAERFRDEPALLIDDIHLLPDNPHVRTELWQLFNEFHDAARKIAVTGLYPPRELPNLDSHLISRLMWGLVARVDISDDDSLRMIMKKLAADRNILLPADVIDYLLIHNRRELPELIAALETIYRISLATNKKISVRLAREALQTCGNAGQ
jgi:chromosomal replication initiator protein